MFLQWHQIIKGLKTAPRRVGNPILTYILVLECIGYGDQDMMVPKELSRSIWSCSRFRTEGYLPRSPLIKEGE